MKKLYILLFTILISTVSFGQVINEFEPNPNGTDPSNVSIEIKGTPGAAFLGYFLSIESDGNNGLVDRSSEISGTFDSNGLLVVSVPDLENPSFTVVLCSNNVSTGTDLDTNNDGTPDNSAVLGTVYDAIGVPDSSADALTQYGADLGGADFAYTGAEPELIFRDGSSGDLYAVNLVGDNTTIFDVNANALLVSNFDTDPSIAPTFGSINPIYTAPTEPTLTLLDGDPSGSTITVGPEDLSGDFEFAVTNFGVGAPGTGTEGDGYIYWEILNITDGGSHDSGDITDLSAQPVTFNTLLPNKTYQLNAILKDNTGTDLTNPEAAYALTANTLGYIDVTSVADLRAVTDDGYYRLINEAFLTFQQSFRGQKFIQDATGGILIDDNEGIISSTFTINDGITNIRGQVSEFGGMKQFVPSTDYGAPSSSGNIITPQTVTLAELTTNAEQYESELVEVIAVTIDNSTNTTFLNGQVYAMSQSADNFDFRATFFDVDYIGATVPTVSTDVVGIINERSGNAYYLSARDTNDISALTLSNDTFKENNFKIYPNPTSLGYVTLSSKNSAKMNVSVFDMLGKQVLNETVSNYTLNVSGLTSGVYIMNISQENARITKKLVIQ